MRRLSRFRAISLILGLTLLLPGAVRDGTPAVGLNHLTLVPDSATFEAIAASAFLRDTFAVVERSPDGEPDRVVLFGRSTFVEFRRPRSGREWSSSVALGTDERGALRSVAKRLTSEIGPVRIDSVSRRRDSTDVPWMYQLASTSGADSTLDLSVVEYHPQFARRWFGDSVAPAKSVARADVLSMQVASMIADKRVSAPFVDVVAIKVAASTQSAASLVAHCRGVGWHVQKAADGTACVGPKVRLFVVPTRRAEHGIVAFTMRVTSPAKAYSAKPRRFGRSSLRVSRNGFATWEFSQL